MGAKQSQHKKESIDFLLKLSKGGPHCEVTGSNEDKRGIIGMLEKYEGGISEQAKEDLIKMFYEIVRKDLNIGKGKPEASNTDEMVQFLSTNVPTLSSAKTVKDGDKVFDEAMKRIAAAINKHSGEHVIDENANSVNIFYSVVMYMKNVMAGFTREYRDIASAVGEISDNLGIISQVLDKQFKGIINRCADDLKSETVKDVVDYFGKMMNKLDLQADYLRNISNTAEKKVPLEDLIAKSKLFAEFPDSQHKGTDLLRTLTGMVETSHLAAKLNHALKSVGMELQNYKKHDFKDFNKEIGDLFTKKLGLRETDKDLLQFMESAKILKEYFPNRKEILGSAELPKSLKDRKKLRNHILVTFTDMLSDLIHGAIAITDRIGSDIRSKDITYSDSMREFMNGFSVLDKLGDLSSLASISGYINDTDARLKRERFISDLKIIVHSAEELAGTSSVFGDLAAILRKVLELVLNVSEKLTEEISISGGDDPLEVILEGEKVGAADDAIPGITLPGLRRLRLDLNNLKYTLEFYVRGTQIKHNLKNALKEIPEYSEKYEELRGKYIGDWINDLSDYKSARSVAISDVAGVPDNMIKLSEKCFNARKRLLEVGESIDEYLVKFQKKVMGDPDAVRSLLQNLSRSEILAEWSEESIGNDLIDLMESFNNINNADIRRSRLKGTGDRYVFNAINSRDVDDDGQPKMFRVGDPYIGTPSSGVDDVMMYINKISDEFLALKNILSLFVTIGQEEAINTYMSIKDIYHALIDYMKYSAIHIERSKNDGAGNKVASGLRASHVDDQQAYNVPTTHLTLRSVFMFSKSVALGNADSDPESDASYIYDQLFVDIIKAIIAKMFISVDAYNSINRPNTLSAFFYRANSRYVLGGGYTDMPEVSAETVKMIRVLWLIEYYKKTLYSDPDVVPAVTDYVIRILPEPGLPSIFADLLRFVCLRVKEAGYYSDIDAAEIARELNRIYLAYAKDMKDPFNKITDDLIDFVNKIATIYRWDDFVAARLELEKELTGIPGSDVDIGLLNVDGNDVSSGLQPSKRFVRSELRTKSVPSYMLNSHEARKICRDFYGKVSEGVDKYMESLTNKTEIDVINEIIERSLQQNIKNTLGEIDQSSTNEEKASAFKRLLRISSPLDSVEISNYIAFHELFMAPMNVLWALLSDTELFLKTISDMQELISKTHKLSMTQATAYFRNDADGVAGNANEIMSIDSFAHHDPVDNKFIRWVNERKIRYFDVGRNGIVGVSNVTGIVGTPSLFNMGRLDASNIVAANDDILETLPRYIIDQDTLLMDLISSLQEFSSVDGGLITFIVDGGDNIDDDINFVLSYGAFEGFCYDLLEKVKNVIDKFRTRIDKSVIERFQGLSPDNNITVYNVERKLKAIFKDSDGIQKVSKNVNEVLGFLRKKWVRGDGRLRDAGIFRGANLFSVDTDPDAPNRIVDPFAPNPQQYNVGAGVGADVKAIIDKYDLNHHQFNVPIACMIYHHPSRPTADFYQVSTTDADGSLNGFEDNAILKKDRINKFLFEENGQIKVGKNESSLNQAVPRFLASCDPTENTRSLVHSFNKIMKLYLLTISDITTGQVFSPCIKEVFRYLGSKEVFIPDAVAHDFDPGLSGMVMNIGSIIRSTYTAIPLNSWPNNTVGPDARNRVLNNDALYPLLHEYLVNIIDQIVTRVKKDDKPKYLEDDITKFTLSYKNLLKKNLPIVKKQFDALKHRAGVIGKFVGKVNVAQVAWFSASSTPKTHLENVRYFKGYLSAVIEGCDNMMSIITKVIDTIDDSMEFFDSDRESLKIPLPSAIGTYVAQELSEDMVINSQIVPYDRTALMYSPHAASIMDFSTLTNDARVAAECRVINEAILAKYFSKTSGLLSRLNKSVTSFNAISEDDINKLLESTFIGAKKIYEAYTASLFSLGVSNGMLGPADPLIYSFGTKRITTFQVGNMTQQNLVNNALLGPNGALVGVPNARIPYSEGGNAQVRNNFAYLVQNNIIYYLNAFEFRPCGYINLVNPTRIATILRDNDSYLRVDKQSYRRDLFSDNTLRTHLRTIDSGDRARNIMSVAFGNLEAKLALAQYVNDQVSKTISRSDIHIKNIIELNVVPIRTTILMKNIPLSNLYTYSATFDRYITDMFKFSRPAAVGGYDGPIIDTLNARDILRDLLICPMAPIEQRSFYRIEKIIRGDINVESWSRPKMLAAEIWGKSLFGDMTAGIQEVVTSLSETYNLNGANLIGNLKQLDARKGQGASVIRDQLFDRLLAIYRTLFNIAIPNNNIYERCIAKNTLIHGPHFNTVIRALINNDGKFDKTIFDSLFLVGDVDDAAIRGASSIADNAVIDDIGFGIVTKYHPIFFGARTVRTVGRFLDASLINIPNTIQSNYYDPRITVENVRSFFVNPNNPGVLGVLPQIRTDGITDFAGYDIFNPTLFTTQVANGSEVLTMADAFIRNVQTVDMANPDLPNAPELVAMLTAMYKRFSIAQHLFLGIYLNIVLNESQSMIQGKLLDAFAFMCVERFRSYRNINQLCDDPPTYNRADGGYFVPMRTLPRGKGASNPLTGMGLVAPVLGRGSADNNTITADINANVPEIVIGANTSYRYDAANLNSPYMMFVPGKRALKLAIAALKGNTNPYFGKVTINNVQVNGGEYRSSPGAGVMTVNAVPEDNAGDRMLIYNNMNIYRSSTHLALVANDMANENTFDTDFLTANGEAVNAVAYKRYVTAESLLAYSTFPKLYVNAAPELKKSYLGFLEALNSVWQWGTDQHDWDPSGSIHQFRSNPATHVRSLRAQTEWLPIPIFNDRNGNFGVFSNISRADIDNEPDVPHQLAYVHNEASLRRLLVGLSDVSRISHIEGDGFESSNKLHVKDNNGNIKKYESEQVRGLREKGRNRFNSVFIRNLFWVTNLQRAIQYKLREDLTYSPSPVISGVPITSPSITEERPV